MPSVEIPKVPDYVKPAMDKLKHFIMSLENNHSDVIKVSDEREVSSVLAKEGYKKHELATNLELLKGIYTDIATYNSSRDLDGVTSAAISASIGVAENGAMWVEGEAIYHRALPFIVEHLVVLITKESLVQTMHEAYKKIERIPDFGLFVAGPSKTADIEQSLVIGAHGPKRMTVFILG